MFPAAGTYGNAGRNALIGPSAVNANIGLFKNIPVIILSGSEDENKRKKCLDLGAFTYLLKPFEPQALLSEVERALQFSKEKILVK